MILFEHTPPRVLLLLAVAVAALAAGVSARRFLPRILPSLWISVLHLLTLLALTWCLLMPARQDTLTEQIKPRFIVALDTSESMAFRLDEGEPSRWDTAQRALALPWVEQVAAESILEIVPFDEQAGSVLAPDRIDRLAPEGGATHLRDSLREIAGRYAGLNVAGLLLLSDGLDTREAHDEWAADRQPMPIYTLRLEPETDWAMEPDVRIDAVTTPRRVTRGRQTELRAMVSGQGTGGLPLTVQLYRDGDLLQERPVRIPAEGGRREAVFTLEHREPGIFDYRVHAPPLEGEERIDDNEYTVTVHVADDRNRLLYVEGVPRWEYRFLRRALLANPDVSATIFFTGPDGQPHAGTPAVDVNADLSEADLALFKVVVLGNLNAEELGTERAERLVRFVETGGSLILQGGTHAWGPQGFSATPLRRLLPVRVPGTAPMQGDEPFSVHLTDEALSHPAFSGDEGLWSALPGVLSVFPAADPSLGAQVLVQAATPQGLLPLVVTHRYGQGTVAALLTDSLWRWQLAPDLARYNPYPRFWTQLTAWMMPEAEEAEQRPLQILADRDRLHQGEAVEISAYFSGIDPPAEAVPQLWLTFPDEREVPYRMTPKPLVTPSGEHFSGFSVRLEADIAGLYRVRAAVEEPPGIPDSDPLSFYVLPYSPETAPRPVHAELLQTLASASGGRYFETLAELDAALSALRLQILEEERSEYASLWRRWLWILILMGMLTATWGIRKAANMP